jgi:hypothetical protein
MGEKSPYKTKKMGYRYRTATPSSIKYNETYEGETIEQKIERVTNNQEPITDGAPLIYTDRKDGVQAGYNIRTDRFEVAIEAMDKVQATKIAQRENKAEMKVVKTDGETESTQATGTAE